MKKRKDRTIKINQNISQWHQIMATLHQTYLWW